MHNASTSLRRTLTVKLAGSGRNVTPRDIRRALLTAALFAVAAVVSGCGNDDESAGEPAQATQSSAAKGTFVGKVDGTAAYIALVSDGRRVVGYVCDSKQVSSWIDVAAIRDGAARLSSRSATALGQATFSDDRVSGSITVGGDQRSFSAELASGQAGLYRAARVQQADGKLGDGELEVGWVVLADGTQRGGTNVGTATKTAVNPAPRLSPNTTNVAVNVEGTATRLALTNVKGITLIPIP